MNSSSPWCKAALPPARRSSATRSQRNSASVQALSDSVARFALRCSEEIFMQSRLLSLGSRHPRTASGVLPLSYLLLLSVSAPAQTGSAPAVAPNPVAKVNVDEVSVDMVVHDKSGKDIPDLKSEELEVLDGSSRVRINDLRRAGAAPGSDRSHSVTLVFDQLDAGNAKSARDAALSLLKAIRESEIAFTVLRVDSRLHLLQAPDRKSTR